MPRDIPYSPRTGLDSKSKKGGDNPRSDSSRSRPVVNRRRVALENNLIRRALALGSLDAALSFFDPSDPDMASVLSNLTPIRSRIDQTLSTRRALTPRGVELDPDEAARSMPLTPTPNPTLSRQARYARALQRARDYRYTTLLPARLGPDYPRLDTYLTEEERQARQLPNPF